MLEHLSQEAEFSMEIVQCQNTCLSKQVHEADRILRTDAEIILNSKSEFHHTTLIRVVGTNGLQEEQTSAAGQGVGAAVRASQDRRGRGGGPGRGRGRLGAAGGRQSSQGGARTRGRGD